MSTKSYFTDLTCWIEKNLSNESLKINDIANKAGYTKWHLQRIFKDQTGVTISRYIKKRRMTKSAMALSFTTMPISEISFLYGFDTQQHFTRVFREHFGTTPLVYRRLPYLNTKRFYAAFGDYVYQNTGRIVLVKGNNKVELIKPIDNICSEFSDGENFVEKYLRDLINKNKNQREFAYVSYEHTPKYRHASIRISEVSVGCESADIFCTKLSDVLSEKYYVQLFFDGYLEHVVRFLRWVYYSYLPSHSLNKIKTPDIQKIYLDKSDRSRLQCDFYFPVSKINTL